MDNSSDGFEKSVLWSSIHVDHLVKDKDTRELFFEIFLFSKQYSYMPELFQVIGEDTFVEFLFVFGGETIKVPSVEDIRRFLIYSYVRSKTLRGSSLEEVLKELNIKPSQYKRMERLVNRNTSDRSRNREKETTIQTTRVEEEYRVEDTEEDEEERVEREELKGNDESE